jgi:hypothetical protein
MSSRDTRNRIPLDSPLNVNDVDVNLPSVRELPPFELRYAAQVANLTGQLRNLQDTIQTLEMTAPELIPQNAPLINAFKEASQKAMDKGFDIRKNGLDKKLTQMGLAKSSTALGAQIALARERNDAEINNALQIAQLGQSTKQQTISNAFDLGKQIVSEASVELNKYGMESSNELNARNQDLGLSQLLQQRGIQQAHLNLGKEQQKLNAELERRKIAAQVAISRNPMGHVLQSGTQNNQLALGAIQGDNASLHNQNMAQTAQQNAQTEVFKANQAAQSNPLLELGMAGAGAYMGNFGGSIGLGNAMNHFGGEDTRKKS